MKKILKTSIILILILILSRSKIYAKNWVSSSNISYNVGNGAYIAGKVVQFAHATETLYNGSSGELTGLLSYPNVFCVQAGQADFGTYQMVSQVRLRSDGKVFSNDHGPDRGYYSSDTYKMGYILSYTKNYGSPNKPNYPQDAVQQALWVYFHDWSQILYNMGIARLVVPVGVNRGQSDECKRILGEANALKSYYENKGEIQCDTGRANLSMVNGQYKIGPFRITGQEAAYNGEYLAGLDDNKNNFILKGYDSNNNEIEVSNWYIEQNGTRIDCPNNGVDFYIMIDAASNTTLARMGFLNFKFWELYVEGMYYNFRNNDAGTSSQAWIGIVNMARLWRSIDKTMSINIELAAPGHKTMKTVQKVNGKNVESTHTITVNQSNVTNPTATITKDTTPKKVKYGDTVIFKIRVYSIGKVSYSHGIITDNLPDGLTFLENSTINKNNKWVKGSGNTVTTDIINGVPIGACTNVNSPPYKDVFLEVQVTKKTNTEKLITNTVEGDITTLEPYIDIKGIVYKDLLYGKANKPTGYYDTQTPDELVKDVKVTLYQCDQNKQNIKQISSTVTNNNGAYEFTQLDPTKYYFVKFEYNGLKYEHTTYDLNNDKINANVKSYVTEGTNNRKTFNKQFDKIDINKQISYPNIDVVVPDTEEMSKFKIEAYSGSDGIDNLKLYTGTSNDDLKENVNLGLIERPIFDVSASKDAITFNLTVNDVPTVYKFDTLEVKRNKTDEPLSVEIKGADLDPYVKYIRKSDLNHTDADGNHSLKMEINYKVKLRNDTNGLITAKIHEFKDWFDKDLQLKTIKIDDQELNGEQYQLGEDGDYKTVNINKEINLMSGENKVIEFTFDINSEEVVNKLLADIGQNKGIVKNNFTEITSYSNYYTNEEKDLNGNVIHQKDELAGLIDHDSVPANFNPNDSKVQEFITECDFPADPANPKYPALDSNGKVSKQRHDKSIEIFEDDADRAPGLILKISEDERHIKGNVFIDGANKAKLEKPYGEKERVGDGLNTSAEGYYPDKSLQGVTVSLWEDKGNEGIDDSDVKIKTTTTDSNGYYEIGEFVPGKYYLTYQYGTEKSNGEKGTLDTTINNGNMINGQDYKSTLYNDNNHKEKTYSDSSSHAWWYVRDDNHESDARDSMTRRKEINSACKEIRNYLANTLNGERIQQLESLTNMTAYTNRLDVEIDYPINESIDHYQQNKGTYEINNINFGVIERPRNDLFLEEKITKVQIVSASTSAEVNNILVDAVPEKKVEGVSWVKGTYDVANRVRNIGKTTVTLDDKLRYGSTIYIYIDVVLSNQSENNYVDDYGNELETYYNTGVVPQGARKATATAKKIVNYLTDDLNFNEENNKNNEGNAIWREIKKGERDELFKEGLDEDIQKNNYVNSEIKSIKSINTVLEAKQGVNELIDKKLSPGDSDIIAKLELQQLLNSEGGQDVFGNSTEIVCQESDVGRRSYVMKTANEPREDNPQEVKAIIPGNLDPILAYDKTGVSIQGDTDQVAAYVAKYSSIDESDSAAAEGVSVVPPFGTSRNYTSIIIIGMVVIIILGTGVYFIKGKVL